MIKGRLKKLGAIAATLLLFGFSQCFAGKLQEKSDGTPIYTGSAYSGQITTSVTLEGGGQAPFTPPAGGTVDQSPDIVFSKADKNVISDIQSVGFENAVDKYYKRATTYRHVVTFENAGLNTFQIKGLTYKNGSLYGSSVVKTISYNPELHTFSGGGEQIIYTELRDYKLYRTGFSMTGNGNNNLGYKISGGITSSNTKNVTFKASQKAIEGGGEVETNSISLNVYHVGNNKLCVATDGYSTKNGSCLNVLWR